MIRAVFDTNILVSGLIYPAGKPRKLIDYALGGKVELISSKPIIDEFRHVIAGEEFRRSGREQERLVAFIAGISSMVKVESGFGIVKEDPDDDAIVNTAYDGKVQYIVSGDKHLLKLKKVLGIRIVTANEMLELLDND